MQWGALMEAAGRMGMSESEFETTTPRYFYHRRKGFESVQLEQARNARQIAFFAVLPHLKKDAVRRPEDLYRLPGDLSRIEQAEKQMEGQREKMKELLRRAKDVDFFKGETLPKFEA